MRTWNLALWMALGLFLWACGGDSDAECGNGIVEPGEECDDDTEACQNCRIAAGWECPPGESCFQVEICDNGIDDTGNGLVDCADPYCETAPNCATECTRQAQCENDDICAGGICRTAGAIGPDGRVLTGDVGLDVQFDPQRTDTRLIKSYTIEYFHPAIPGKAETLTCETLAELARAGELEHGELNVLRTTLRDFPTSGLSNYLLRDSGVFATPDDVNWVVLTRFFEGTRDSQTDQPTGRMLAFACEDSLPVFAGEWENTRRVTVEGEPGCRGDEHCPESWTCMAAMGLCMYRQCDPACTVGFTCRQDAAGEPVCLQKCHQSLHCPPGYRCDQTPGWEPACYES